MNDKIQTMLKINYNIVRSHSFISTHTATGCPMAKYHEFNQMNMIIFLNLNFVQSPYSIG